MSREPLGSAIETGPIVGRSSNQVASTRVRTLVAVVVAVAVAVGATVAVMSRFTTVRSPQSLARLMITLPATQALEKGRLPPLALSPDGKLLVYAAAVSGGRTKLYLRPLDELDARPIPATEGASTPFFSPDGRWLAFFADGVLKKVSVAGGVPLTICEAPPIWSASWGEQDTIVFATTLAASGLWRVSANGGEPIQITTPKPDETQHGYPQLLPGAAACSSVFDARTRGSSLSSTCARASGSCSETEDRWVKAPSIFQPDISSMRKPAGWSSPHSIHRAARSINLPCRSSNVSRRRDSEARTLRWRPRRERSCMCRPGQR